MPRKIKIRAYSGGRAVERPIEMIDGHSRLRLVLLQTWLQEDLNTGLRRRYFIVKDEKGRIMEVYHDEHTDEWYMT